MKNKYQVFGEMTVIYLNGKDGEVLSTLIDTEDLQTLLDYPYSWYPDYKKNGIYVLGTEKKENGGFSNIRLHRWLRNPPGGMLVDHVNRNPLDNRKGNLRFVTSQGNNQNRGKGRVTTSKHVGVSYNKQSKRWKAYYKKDGKLYHLGYFKTEEEAAKASQKARAENLPFSLEATRRKVVGSPSER